MLAMGGLLAALLVWWLGCGDSSRPGSGALAERERLSQMSTNAPAVGKGAVRAEAGTLAMTLGRLRAASGPGAAREVLQDLCRQLNGLPATERVGVIRGFLEAKQDAPTGLGFVVQSDGKLAEAPSLRVFLLDLLAQIDPAAAAAYAEKVLGTMNSADEWAVALRNVAAVRSTTEARDFLSGKMAALLGNESWRREASTGYLEAFDVAVFLGGTNLMPPLAELLRQKESPALAHAAYLALDRLVIAEPSTVLGALAAAPEWMQGREETRANYFARADVRDAGQRRVVEEYLLNPEISAAELQKFAGLYPNANYMVSQNLLTRVLTPTQAELAARDRQALAVVNEWLQDVRFAGRHRELETMRRRLEGFVRGGP
jgi:hypothetical protein